MKIRNKIILLLLLLICAIYFDYVKNNRLKRLSNYTYKTIAIFDSFIIIHNSGPVSYFYFKSKKDKKLLLEVYKKCDFLQKGDTVLIEYSIENPSVGKVIDFCYMKKHKGKDYCKCLDE